MARLLRPRKKIDERKIQERSAVRDRIAAYRNGAEGCIKWIEDYCYSFIYPEGDDSGVWWPIGKLPDKINPKTNRTYKEMWKKQKEVLREALRMEKGRFIYRLIVLCWPRGEGKSFLLCLILLWRFFNWPRQQIMLGANSKDQVKFVHFDIMVDIIRNSPELYQLIGGERNIQEKEIILRDSKGAKRSIVRSISSFSGIVSNITNYSFSEIFDMKNPRFFTQLDGSIRAVPNAFGMIDSTVSVKTHILYSLYTNWLQKKTKTVFFSYRYTNGNSSEYWNPNTDEDQLNDYKAKFLFGDFERYFLNLWEAGRNKVFTDEMIEEMKYLGCNGQYLNHNEIRAILEKKNEIFKTMDVGGPLARLKEPQRDHNLERIENLTTTLIPVEGFYKLKDKYGIVSAMNMDELLYLSDIFDTNWAILSGTDFGDPYSVKGRARTILVIIAKGLIGSRSNPFIMTSSPEGTPKYLYFVVGLYHIEDHSLDMVKTVLENAHDEYGGVDALCSERYGAWDFEKWCEERDIAFEPVYPNYGRQKDAFKELLMAVRDGRFKIPPTAIPGSKQGDIFVEEMGMFDHQERAGVADGWFGSPEKDEKYGIQDDAIFATAWCMYGGRMLNPDDFRIRRGGHLFGAFIPQRGLVGKYA